MANLTERYGDTIGDVSDLVSSKKEFIFKQAINIALVFVIMFVFGCFDFMHATFHWEYLADQDYWVSVAMKTLGDVCAFNIGINLMIDDAIKRSLQLAVLKKQYEELNKYRDRDFDYYVDNVYNRKMKIIAYKAKIDFHIRMLNKVSKAKNRVLYSSDDPNKQELKKANKYCIHRASLESLKTDDFIEKNFENLSVRYKDVDPAIFELELDGSRRVIQNKVTGSITEGRIKSSLTTILSVVMVSMFISSILLQPNKDELEEDIVNAMNWVIRCIGDVGVILWQLFRGTLSAGKIVSQQLTVPYSERVKILKGYYAWRVEQGKSVPQYYLNLLKENKDDYVEIELTKEELAKLTKK